jgi:hypothetical protein
MRIKVAVVYQKEYKQEINDIMLIYIYLKVSKYQEIKNIYQTLVRPVVTHGGETWTLTLTDENALRIYERKMLRNIYGPVL